MTHNSPIPSSLLDFKPIKCAEDILVSQRILPSFIFTEYLATITSRTYAQVAASPIKSHSIVKSHSPSKSRSPSPTDTIHSTDSNFINTTVRQKTEINTGLKCIYLLSLPYMKVGQLRKHMANLNFHMKSIINMSYVGKQVVECLVPKADIHSFRINARKNHIGVRENYDPTNHHDQTLRYWLSDLEYKTSQELHIDFIKRIAYEVANTNNPLTSAFYHQWVTGLGESKAFNNILKNIKASTTSV